MSDAGLELRIKKLEERIAKSLTNLHNISLILSVSYRLTGKGKGPSVSVSGSSWVDWT